MRLTGWNYAKEIIVDHTKVGAALYNFPVYVNLANMPLAFWSNVKDGGGDIRVVKPDGTELAREVVSCNVAAKTGELYFKADSLSNSIDTSLWINCGNPSANDYAVTDTYGRNAVWSAYIAVYHLNNTPTGDAGDITDATGNGNNMTSVNMASGNKEAGLLGSSLTFNGTDEYIFINSALNTTLPTSITAVVKPTGIELSTEYTLFSTAKSSATTDDQFMGVDTNGGVQTASRGPAPTVLASSTSQMADDTWAHIASVWNSTSDRRAYLNGGNKGTNTNSKSPTGLDRSGIGVRMRLTFAGFWLGSIDEMRLISEALTDEWVSTENNNFLSTFYTLGSEIIANKVLMVL